jgi:serine/threonine protein kinase
MRAMGTDRLGRYDVIRHLATGGMADVLLARASGIEGFERHVVLKRIKAEHARDERFIRMFLDEARLAASLHHQNVIQVNDIGEQQGEYFFAMEYVHGQDLRSVLQTVVRNGDEIPLAHIVAIGSAMAAGLHYAHEKKGADGVPLGIVHRDVSPSNILVGYDGAVKIVDFGIAKAAVHEETQSGTLKGKVAYMSPEQCLGATIDRRSDVWGVGVVLYELATASRLFTGESDYTIMNKIVTGQIPPLVRRRRDLPPPLVKIIMRALATDVTRRFQTAGEMRQALEELASQMGSVSTPNVLAAWIEGLFGAAEEPWAGTSPSRPAMAKGTTPVERITPEEDFVDPADERLHDGVPVESLHDQRTVPRPASQPVIPVLPRAQTVPGSRAGAFARPSSSSLPLRPAPDFEDEPTPPPIPRARTHNTDITRPSVPPPVIAEAPIENLRPRARVALLVLAIAVVALGIIGVLARRSGPTTTATPIRTITPIEVPATGTATATGPATATATGPATATATAAAAAAAAVPAAVAVPAPTAAAPPAPTAAAAAGAATAPSRRHTVPATSSKHDRKLAPAAAPAAAKPPALAPRPAPAAIAPTAPAPAPVPAPTPTPSASVAKASPASPASAAAAAPEKKLSLGPSIIPIATVQRVAANYERALSKNCESDEELRGDVTVHMIVDASGKVTRTQVSSTIGKPKVAACIVMQVKKWKFPARPGAEPAQATYSMSFQ